MKEHDVIYLAGLVDGIGSFEVQVGPHDNYATGFRFEPKIRIRLRESDTAVLGLLDEYCEYAGVKYTIKERKNSDVLLFTVQSTDHISRFTDPMGPYLIRNHENARIMLNEIIPAVKDGKHRSKRGLYELVEYVEKLRSGTSREQKYDQAWFEENVDLSE